MVPAPAAILRHIRALAGAATALERTDRELLQYFAAGRDEVAFSALVRRHGPLVFSVCRHVLRHEQDAEDAFQATFLVLARKAASIHKKEAVGGWLHGVAYRTAMNARRAMTRRRKRDQRAEGRMPEGPVAEASLHELQALLDAEVERLPNNYRAPFVLCCLEGRSKVEAARELGWKEGTVSSRLAEARERLRQRMVRHGVTLSAALTAEALVGDATAAVSATLTAATVRGVLTAGAMPAQATAWAEGVLSAMSMVKWKAGAVLALTWSILAAGAFGYWRLASSEPQEEQPKAVDAKPAAESRNPKADLHGDPLPEGAVARIGTTRLRDIAGTTVIAFSQDGHRLAYGNENGLIHVCEAADGKPLLDLQPDKVNFNPVTELAFSPDGRTLAVGGYWYEALWLIDLATRKVRQTIPNTAPGQNRWGREWQGPGFAFTPDGRTLVVGGKDGALHLWDPATGTEQATLLEATEPVLSLTLTANGRSALTTHRGGALHLWDVASRKHLRKLAASAKSPYLYLTALAPDGKTVALASGDEVLELWDPDGGRRHQLRCAAPVVGLGFTPDGASLQVADGDGCVTVWDARTGKKLKTLTCEGVSLRGTDGRIQPRPSAWFRSDGKVMAWAVVGAVRLWDLATGQETPRLLLYPQGIAWAGFSVDGRLLRAGGVSGELGVWDATTGRQRGPLRKTPLTRGARYSPAADRGRVVVVTSDNDIRPQPGEGRSFLWDPTGDGRPVPLREQAEPVGNAALTPDNRFVVAPEATGRIRVYDVTTGKPTRSFDGRKNEYRPTFSPDGVLLATTAADGAIRLYDFASGRLLHEMKGQFHAGCIAFSPDGRTLASGHFTPGQSSEAIYLWDTASGRELQRIPTKHGGGVQALAFSPDGWLLASCGLDGAVRLWESASGQERRRYQGHRSWALSIDFAPDGGRLASASLDGTAVVWQVFGPAPAERSAVDYAALWADLTRDGITAHRAMAALIVAPRQALPLLRERLRPAVPADSRRVARLIAELDSERFAVRENATRELERLGESALPALRKVLADSPSAEVHRRVEQLLAKPAGADRLRDVRAVEALEHIGTSDAREVLQNLAKGTAEARLTREAKAALERLAKR